MLGTIVFKDNTTLDDPYIKWENGETEALEINDVVTLPDGTRLRVACDSEDQYILAHEQYDMEGVIVTKMEKQKVESPYI